MSNNPAIVIALVSFFSAIGVTLGFRLIMENFVAGLILRSAKSVKPGRRMKVLIPPLVLKGDVIIVGPLRTSLMEVGDGEHLPSIRTGRLIKLPNTMLVNNPIIAYGETITDEVIAQVKLPVHRLDDVIAKMHEAIRENSHKPVEVGLYQKDDHLIIHGVFDVTTPLVTDERTRVLKSFLEKIGDRVISGEVAAGSRL